MSESAVVQLPPESPAETAARWFALRRRKPDSLEEQQFADWLECDPANRRAYEEVTRSWEISALASADPTVVAMRSDALMLRPQKQREYAPLWGTLATAATVLLGLTGIYVTNPGLVHQAMRPGPSPDHMLLHTGVGQQATATLQDGTSVTLNTDSTLEVDYSALRRDVRLISGQALFKVVHNASRPFVVTAGNRQVIDVGTEFEVELQGQKVSVALLEGRVQVQPLATSARDREAPTQPVAILAPGEQLIAGAEGDVTVKPADVEQLVSWKSGRIRFNDTPLSDAVAEMNRYNHTPIVLADPSLSDIRITGSFRAGQSWPFAEAVGEAFSLKAEVTGDSIRIRRQLKINIAEKN